MIYKCRYCENEYESKKEYKICRKRHQLEQMWLLRKQMEQDIQDVDFAE
jgi:hypothetical protein